MSRQTRAEEIEIVVNILADGPISLRDLAIRAGMPITLLNGVLAELQSLDRLEVASKRVPDLGKVKFYSFKTKA